jgi:hypothetical protein
VASFQQHDALWKINIAEESAKLATLGLVSTGKSNGLVVNTNRDVSY